MYSGESNGNTIIVELTSTSSLHSSDEDQSPPYYEEVKNDPGIQEEKSPSPEIFFNYEGSRPALNAKPRNIILFGETGVGKSSVINLIAGEEVAKTSPNARGCTLHSMEHLFTVNEMQFRVYDTVGLEEPEIGVNTFFGAIEKAHQLVTSLNAAGGIDLLLFCVRAGRITAAVQRSYRLFFEFLCEKKVPLVLVITHLEQEDNMEDWWLQNSSTFREYGIVPVAHACITAAPPRLTHLAEKRAQSQRDLRNMLYKTLGPNSSPYLQDIRSWFTDFIIRLRTFLKGPQSLKSRKRDLSRTLERRCSFRSEDAKKLADLLVRKDLE